VVSLHRPAGAGGPARRHPPEATAGGTVPRGSNINSVVVTGLGIVGGRGRCCCGAHLLLLLVLLPGHGGCLLSVLDLLLDHLLPSVEEAFVIQGR